MKRKNTLGVTLLEIMLVLAIAAMVIIMSIRYYQSSSLSEQANAGMEEIQAIIAAMDNIANGGGGNYSGITTSTLTAVVGSTNMVSPTGGTVTFTASTDGITYGISMPLGSACTQVLAKVASNIKITSPACAVDGTFSYTYNNNAT